MKRTIASGILTAGFVAASLAAGIVLPFNSVATVSATAVVPNVAMLEQAIYRIKALPGYTTYAVMDDYTRAKATPYFREYQYLNELISVLESMISNYNHQTANDLIDIINAADDAVIACGLIFGQSGGAAAATAPASAANSAATSASSNTATPATVPATTPDPAAMAESDFATTAAAPLRASSALTDASTANPASATDANSAASTETAPLTIPTLSAPAGRSRSRTKYSFVTVALEALALLEQNTSIARAQD